MTILSDLLESLKTKNSRIVFLNTKSIISITYIWKVYFIYRKIWWILASVVFNL